MVVACAAEIYKEQTLIRPRKEPSFLPHRTPSSSLRVHRAQFTYYLILDGCSQTQAKVVANVETARSENFMSFARKRLNSPISPFFSCVFAPTGRSSLFLFRLSLPGFSPLLCLLPIPLLLAQGSSAPPELSFSPQTALSVAIYILSLPAQSQLVSARPPSYRSGPPITTRPLLLLAVLSRLFVLVTL